MSPPRRRRRSARDHALSRALARADGRRRLGLLLLCHLLITVLIASRLVLLQGVGAEEYRALGERQLVSHVELPAPRGSILDRDGDPLARTQQAAAIAGDPTTLHEAGIAPEAVAEALAEDLDRDPGALAERLDREDTSFVYLARQVPSAVGERLADRALPGIHVLDEPVRRYPGGRLAAPVLGFAGLDGEGLSGLEHQLDDRLLGDPGSLRVERAPTGQAIAAAERVQQPARPGDDVVLTLDRRVQHRAEAALDAALEDLDAQEGAAVVLDARSAEVLAMASAPGFDQAEIGEVPTEQRRNIPVTDVFEPGSVGKIATLAAALDHGVTDPDETLDLPAAIEVGGKRFTDPHRSARSELELTEAVARSSNVAAIELAERLGDERLHAILERLGVGHEPGVGFPGAGAGILPEPDAWSATSRPTIAIGQAYAMTLLQLASATQSLADDGVRTTPTLVRGVVGEGRYEPASEPERARVVEADTAAALREMLTAVVEEGTGQRAAVEGYRVAGKTGTAQKPREDAAGYEPGAYRGVFAGFAPASDPAVVIAVMLDEPDPPWGGESAAPVFAEIAEAALTARGIPPDAPAADAPSPAEAPSPPREPAGDPGEDAAASEG